MEIGTFLKELRIKAGLTQKDAAAGLQACGINKTHKAIYSYEKGHAEPNADIFLHLCKLYNCDNPLVEMAKMEGQQIPNNQFTTEEVLLVNNYRQLDYYGRDAVNSVMESELRRIHDSLENKKNASLQYEPDNLFVELPYYPMAAGMGTGRIVENANPEKMYVPLEEVPSGTDFLIVASGNSMLPKYESGDLLCIKSCNTINVGEIGLFNVNGEQVVKKLGEGVLESLNPDYSPISLKNSTVYVQGKVLGKLEE